MKLPLILTLFLTTSLLQAAEGSVQAAEGSVQAAAGSLAAAGAVQAAAPATDHHEELFINEQLSLGQLIELVHQRHFAQGELRANMDYAEAWEKKSQSLLAQGPELLLRYQSDGLQKDYGLAEYEAGLTLPLWRWGQKSNARDLSVAIASGTAATSDELKWMIAGELRALLWDLEIAHSRHDLAEVNLSSALKQREVLARQVALGDLPRADLLLVDLEIMEARQFLTLALADAVDLGHEYAVLTGMTERPAQLKEVLASSDSADSTPDPAHPFIRAASARLEFARREAAAETYQAKGAPNVLIGPRWERGIRQLPYQKSIGIIVTVPLGGSGRRKLIESAGAIEVAKAQRELDRRLREQQMALHEARHQYEVNSSRAEETGLIRNLSVQRRDLMQMAFGAGEISLIEFMRSRTAAREAIQAAQLAELALERAVAMRNQALGVLP